MPQATEKQVNYAFVLLGKAGYSTRYMDKRFKALGATMRERSGTVRAWLESRNIAEMSRIIDTLQSEAR